MEKTCGIDIALVFQQIKILIYSWSSELAGRLNQMNYLNNIIRNRKFDFAKSGKTRNEIEMQDDIIINDSNNIYNTHIYKYVIINIMLISMRSVATLTKFIILGFPFESNVLRCVYLHYIPV